MFWLDSLLLFWLTLGLAFLFGKLKRTVVSKRLFVGGFLWLFIITCSPIPNILIYGLESKYRTYSRSRNDKIDYILVLGGGFTENKTLPNFEQLSTASLSRISEAMRIKKIFPAAKLVMSGSKMNRTISQAEIYAHTVFELGFQRNDVVLLNEPKNTAEEAKSFNNKFGKGAKFILVTDAAQIGRAHV